MKNAQRLLVLLALLLSAGADAAVVRLKDGSLLRGTVVGATARDVRLHTPDGTLTIDAERIQRIDYLESDGDAPDAPGPRRYEEPRARATESWDDARQLISLGFGIDVPASRLSLSGPGAGSRADNGNTGLLVGAQYVYYVTRRLAAGMHLEYFGRSDAPSQSLLPLADSNVSGGSLATMAVLRYTLIPKGAVRPYLLAGVGPHRTSTVVESRPLVGFVWPDTGTDEERTIVDDSHWGLATTARLGLDFELMNPAIFSFEIGWTGLSGRRSDSTPAGKAVDVLGASGDLNVLTIGGRWGWRF